jgi:hypothetical protein
MTNVPVDVIPITPYYDREGITIYCGDNADVLPNVWQYVLLLTDPPYGLGAHKKSFQNSTATRLLPMGSGDWDTRAPDPETLGRWISKASKSILWGGNYFGLPPQRCWLVWDKQTGKNDYADCELAWTDLDLDMVVKMFTHYWLGANAKDRGAERLHPTQKPLALMEWCVNLVPNTMSIIDPYMGCGTTLMVARKLGIAATGIEISERYCEMAVKRLRQKTMCLT